ncbi:Macrolide export ATP-binding/permease protein MacB [Enhygromyxa salina]|uniref:Macrolide export ATP-binding/permease protein MacB n=1 Tax=Enhygromyxa salina TaxID=215803 RepID=A0A2S9XE87_9BACT|nr:ABC transporter ATP-binding protein [Enhygromyxa salina]PRP91175.1 Macrolide export ATP-binding/permease protein MacB [Enhygromyxa salina]
MSPKPPIPAPLISLTRVTKIYGEGEARVAALDGVDLVIEQGEFVMVMGSSGSGKSTCMNILGCLDTPTTGEYRFGGVDVSRLDHVQLALLRRTYLGFVFQSFNLLARTSAVENVELPLIYQRVDARQRRERALTALREVGLLERARHTPAQLSGGQQQRVAIARALVSRPAVVFADEPTGNLDTERSKEIMRLLVELNRERAITVVMVTHEPELAEVASRVLVFRDGRVIADGPPREVL